MKVSQFQSNGRVIRQFRSVNIRRFDVVRRGDGSAFTTEVIVNGYLGVGHVVAVEGADISFLRSLLVGIGPGLPSNVRLILPGIRAVLGSGIPGSVCVVFHGTEEFGSDPTSSGTGPRVARGTGSSPLADAGGSVGRITSIGKACRPTRGSSFTSSWGS